MSQNLICNAAAATRTNLRHCWKSSLGKQKKNQTANKERTRQQQKQKAVSSLELKYNLRRCIYSHTFNKPERCKWVPEYLKGKQKNKGKVSIHNRSRFQRVNTAARTARAVVFPKVKNVVQKKRLTASRISEHPYLYISFFFLLLLGIQKQYQTLGKVISWQNQEQTHA